MLTATKPKYLDITKYLDKSQNKSNKKYTKSPGTCSVMHEKKSMNNNDKYKTPSQHSPHAAPTQPPSFLSAAELHCTQPQHSLYTELQ